LAEYEQKALELAGNPEKFAQLKQKLNTETEKSNLFNPTQFVRDLEGIFLDVVNKHNSM
jgi:predicted O-linked N-acetylglucosamine transferase (SPINDLY family)